MKKAKFSFFHDIFLNKDISMTVLDIILKLCMQVLHSHAERILSQNFYLGP